MQPAVCGRATRRDGRARRAGSRRRAAIRTRVQNSGGPALSCVSDRGRCRLVERRPASWSYLRAGLGEAVGERSPARRPRARAGAAPPEPGRRRSARSAAPADVRGRRRAAARASSRRGSRASRAARAARAARGRSRSARARRRSSRRSPSAQDRESADVRQRQRAQPALLADRGRARRPSRARSTGGCRRSARPAWARTVVPEVWITTAVASRSWQCRPGERRRARPAAPPQRLLDEHGGAGRDPSRSAGARRRSTGTATAPSSRQACSACANSRPGGQRDRDARRRARHAARGQLARRRRARRRAARA